MDIRLFLVFVGTFAACRSTNEDLVPETIVFANILYRHGDRTPINPYRNDPYRNETFWPVPFGQLTNLGKRQHLLLGRWLRKRYSHLLHDTYTPYDIYIQSTDVDRTLMSAEVNLAGLYPPIKNQIWDRIKWMPIPVHTIPEDEDYILGAKKYCPRYEYELQKVLASPELERINKANAKLYAYLAENSGNEIFSLETVEYLYDTLYVESLYNKTLPQWTESVFPDKLKSLAALSFKVTAYNKILQKLKSGSLLKDMIDHMVKKSRNILMPNRQIWMYSAHDQTIANMLMTLNLFEPHCPPYIATILIELRRNPKNLHFVTISYKNSTEEPTLMTLPGCATMCPLDEFIRLTKDAVPEDWERECLLDTEDYKYNISTTAVIAVLMSSVLLVIVLAALVIGFVYWHDKRVHNQYYFRLTTDAI